MRKFLILSILPLVFGCGDSGPLEPAADAVMFHEYKSVLQPFTSQPTLVAFNVALDGDSLYVMVRDGFGETATFHYDSSCTSACEIGGGTVGGARRDVLYVSDDLGKSFRTLPLPEIPAPTGHQGLHVVDGKPVHVYFGTEYHFQKLDFQAGAVVPDDRLAGVAPRNLPHARGTRIAAWGHVSSGFDRYIEAVQYDIASDTLYAEGRMSTMAEPLPFLGRPVTADGDHFIALAQPAAQPDQVCLARFDFAGASSPLPTLSSCVSKSMLPPALSFLSNLAVSPDGQSALAFDQQPEKQVWLWPLTEPLDAARAIELPPEVKIVWDGRAVRPLLSGAVLSRGGTLGTATAEYLYWTGQGTTFEALRFPGLCEEGAPCGDSEPLIAAALPLQGDEWLVIYGTTVTENKSDITQRLYLRRVRPTRATVKIEGKPLDAGDLVDNALFAGRLGKACTRAASCGKMPFRDCMEAMRWGDEQCASRSAFFEAAEKPSVEEACAALFATNIQVCQPSGPICADALPSCEGDILHQCQFSVGTPAHEQNCQDQGLSCVDNACGVAMPKGSSLCPVNAAYEWQSCLGGRYLGWCAPGNVGLMVDCVALGYAKCVDAVAQPGQPNIPARCE